MIDLSIHSIDFAHIVIALALLILAWYVSTFLKLARSSAGKKSLDHPPPRTFAVSSVDSDFKWDNPRSFQPFPFKNAPYKLTMGIRNIQAEEWLLIEPTYKQTIDAKKMILNNRHPAYPQDKDTRARTLFVTEEAIPAIKEFYATITQYLAEKYPQYFVKSGSTLENKITGESIPFSPSEDCDPNRLLEDIAASIEEDFLILLKDPSRRDEKDGTEFFFKAGVFAFAAGFDPRDRFNTPLLFIHHPIPGYEEKLKLLMNRFFDRLKPATIVNRNNFSVQTHNKYFVDDENKGHNLPADKEQEALEFDLLDFEKQVHYRSERQCLTKLPQSGAIIFTIRTYLLPMSEVKKEGPELCERLIGAIKGFPPEIAEYKRANEWGPPVIEYLERA